MFSQYKKITREGYSFGAPSPRLFEHIYQLVASIPLRDMRKIMGLYMDMNQNQQEVISVLTQEQLVLYWFSKQEDGSYHIAEWV